MKDIELFNEFKNKEGIESDFATYCYDKNSIDEILSGIKTKEYSLYDSYVLNHEPLPIKGDYAVVVNEDYEAICVLILNAINIIEYKKASSKEDLKAEANEMNLTLNPETLVVEENFLVVYKK